MIKEEIAKFNLRLPQKLYEEIMQRANLNRRSINNEMVVLLEEIIIQKGPITEKDRELFDEIYKYNYCARHGLDPTKPIPPDFNPFSSG